MCDRGKLASVSLVFQVQAFYVQVTDDKFSECRLDLLKVIRATVRHSSGQHPIESDQGLFFWQMLDFLQQLLRLLQRFVVCDSMTVESDWQILSQYGFASTNFLDVPSFLEKTELRARSMPVSKLKVDAVREKIKRHGSSEICALSLIGATVNRFLDSGRIYIRYVPKELFKHPSFKWDLVMGMAWFDYSTLFVLPLLQAIECYYPAKSGILQSPSCVCLSVCLFVCLLAGFLKNDWSDFDEIW